MAETLDTVIAEIQAHPGRRPRSAASTERPRLADDRAPDARRAGPAPRWSTACRSRGRSAAAPGAALRAHASTPSTCKLLEAWMRSYRPEELFDEARPAHPRARASWPRRASAGWGPTRTPTAAILLRDLRLPDFRDYAVEVPQPGSGRCRGRTQPWASSSATSIKLNDDRRNFRIFGPDETASNRLTRRLRGDEQAVARRDRARPTTTSPPTAGSMEMLSEHQCEGWLEGYLLTGRHGLFNYYEAFIHIIDSMFNQHAKWLKVTRQIPWRRPIASLNYPARLARLAAGPQRVHAPGPGLHRPRGQQEGRGHPRLPAARRQLPALGDGPLPAEPRTTST